MNIWRMKLRAGNHGDDMFHLCWDRHIAAITYQPIYDTDLTHLNRWDLDQEVKSSARASMFRFAWEICGGDEILVGDSISKCIVARGYVSSVPGQRAYRYNGRNPITEPRNPNVSWRHEVPVAWDSDFEPFEYRDGAPLITVMHFDASWVQSNGESAPQSARTSASNDERDKEFLNEDAYMRQTHESLRNIKRLHAALSNRFREWLRIRHSVYAEQERDNVDLTFEHEGLANLAELKICYGGNTKAAIREALGQLFEYNHYPPRLEAHSWWLVLDHEPGTNDRRFIATLREKYSLPLRIAWPVDDQFNSFPKWPAN